MKKYSKKRHLSLEITKDEAWVKRNKREHRIYRNVDDNWQGQLEKLSAEQKLRLFFKYALEGNKKMLKAVYTASGEEFDINGFDKDGNNALMFAIKSGKKEVVKFLLDIGVNPNYINNLGFSPIHLAVRKNSLPLVSCLFDNGAYIEIEDKDGQTPIFDAVCENNPQMIACLCLNGADINYQNKKGLTPLMLTAVDQRRQEAMLELIRCGADVNAQDEFGKNAFMHAIENDNNPMMDILLKHGTLLNAKDRRFMTAVMYCAKKGNREGLRVLIARGADIFARDIHGRSALDLAIKYSHKTCEEILVKAERISNSELSADEKSIMLKEFAKHNKVENSCAR